jgi:hypothetical protein
MNISCKIALSVALAVVVLPANAVEFVDGDNEPPSQLNGMHSCPQGFLVTGVHVDKNLLLCTGFYGNSLVFPAAQSWGGPQFTFDNTSMHWCGSREIVRGVHVDGNGFNCQSFKPNAPGSLGSPFLDRGSNPTQRQGMHACPIGSVLVGAHFATNTFLCAPLPFCADDAQCNPGSRCVSRLPNSVDSVCQSTR